MTKEKELVITIVRQLDDLIWPELPDRNPQSYKSARDNLLAIYGIDPLPIPDWVDHTKRK